MRCRCSLLVLAAVAPLSHAAPAELLNGQSHTLHSVGLTAHFADGREPGRTVKRLHASGDVTIISLADTGSESAPLGSSASAANQASASAPVGQQASGAAGGGGGGGSAGSGEPLEIVFAVLTGKEHHQDRAEASKLTWCTDINACIFFSDTPSESLPTVSISFEGLPQSLSKYSKAQLRYVPVLNYMRELITSGQDEMFAKAKWLVIVDDDTFVFHHNLASYLRTLDDTTPIYTGDVVPDEWLPVSRDGMGNELGVSSPTVFVNGGGGSVFSRAALQKMDTERCVNNTMPGQPWWRWQSDWMIGACAADAGITPLRQPQGRFNQFACTEDSVQFCEGVEVAEYYWPSTMHPVRLEAQMRHLYHYYENPTTRPVPRVRMRRVNSNNDVMMAQGGSPSDNYVAASGLELSQ